MDIRQQQTQTNNRNSQNKKGSALTFKAGKATNASSALIIPQAVSTKLTEISSIYGIPLNIGAISLSEATPENVRKLRAITQTISNNSKLLPEMLKLIKQLLGAEIKLSQFHVKLTKAALKHQESIDKDTADIFLQMAGYASKAGKLQHRTNTRNRLIDRRNAAYEDYYTNSVFAEQSRIIDAEFQLAASNNKIMADSRIQRKEFQSKQKEKALSYIDSAFAE